MTSSFLIFTAGQKQNRHYTHLAQLVEESITLKNVTRYNVFRAVIIFSDAFRDFIDLQSPFPLKVKKCSTIYMTTDSRNMQKAVGVGWHLRDGAAGVVV